jgi:hypothetical protein
MTRTTSLVAAVGILTAVICLPLAAALHRNVGDAARWPLAEFGDWGDDDDMPAGNTVTRDFPWGDSDRLELQVAGSVHFQPAAAWHLSIRGPERVLDRLTVTNGRIALRHAGMFHHHSGAIEVQLAGPALHDIGLDGSGNLTLENLKQDSVSIHIRGSGSARGNGSVGVLRLEILGSGSAGLEQLAAGSATVRIAGSGDADIAPTDSADVDIAGSGEVRLHSQPRRIHSQVHGSGRIIEMPGQPTDGGAVEPTIAFVEPAMAMEAS